MSTPAKRLADLSDPSSFPEPCKDVTPATGEPSERQIEEAVPSASADIKGFEKKRFRPRSRPSNEPSESSLAIEPLSARIKWRRPMLALAFAGVLYIVLGDDLRFPWASAGSSTLAQKRGEPAHHEVSKLIVSGATPRPMDQPVPLGVSVDNSNDLNFLEISGLPKGTTLSEGLAVGDDGWLLYAMNSKEALIRPPPHFVGVMELTVSLIVGAGNNASESRPLRFEWRAENVAELNRPDEARPAAKVQDETSSVAKVPDEAPSVAKVGDEKLSVAKGEDEAPTAAKVPDEAPSVAKVPDEAPSVAKVGDEKVSVAKVEDEAPPVAKVQDETSALAKVEDEAPTAAKVQDEAPPVAKPGSQTNRRLSPEETAELLKRGNELVLSGDLAAARLVLRRAAEAGNARAAFALAGTYNPITLAELHVHGLSPDLAMARHWYEKAKELGSPDAVRELQILAIRRN